MLLEAHVAQVAEGLGCLKHVVGPQFENLSIFCDSVVLMLHACEPLEIGGARVGGPSGFEHFEFFFLLDSVFLMLHALGLEAPLIPSEFKDFDSLSFFLMTLFF